MPPGRSLWLRRSTPIWLSIALVLAALAGLIADLGPLAGLRNAVFDTYQRLHPRQYRPAPVRLVVVDDESLRRHGRWPWHRQRLAELIGRLDELGAAVIALDIVLAEPDATAEMVAEALGEEEAGEILDRLPDADRELADGMAAASVITGFALTDRGAETRAPAAISRNVIRGEDPRPFLLPFGGALVSLPVFEERAAGNGALNTALRNPRDGVLRHVALLFRLEAEDRDGIFPSLTAEALRVRLGEVNYRVEASSGGVGSVGVGDLTIRTDRHARVWLHYSGPVAERVIPAWRLLAGEVAAEEVAGTVVVVGVSALGLTDRWVVPLGTTIAGSEIHVQAVEQMLQGTYLVRPEWARAAEALLLIALSAALIWLFLRFGPVWSAVVGLLAVGAAVLGSWLLFAQARLLVDPFLPAATCTAIYLVCSLARQVRTERDRRWIRQAFSSYISPNLVEYLIANQDELKPGGSRRRCSFVCTDLAGFTSLVEKADPEAAIALLNEYLDRMTAIALEHEGTLDRIVGDAVAVMFSAPVTQPDHAERAVACALAMDDFAQRFSRRKREEGVAVGLTRIGVNTGWVTIGNVGGRAMVDYRALGDAINTAARLESVNRHLGTRVCVSRVTAEDCPSFRGRPVGSLVLKGKSAAVEALEPLTAEQEASAATASYLAAFELMLRRSRDAREAFAKHLRSHPEDRLAAFHLERLQRGEVGAEVVLASK